MNAIKVLSKYFKEYITINGLTGATYTYAVRSDKRWPVVSCYMHMAKCKPSSWLYIAIDANADMNNLNESDMLYIGSQTQDRMFRGDGLKGNNFHHQEMRNGKGGSNLESYLANGSSVKIYVLDKSFLERITNTDNFLIKYKPILDSKEINKKVGHAGYWYEQIILSENRDSWSWNCKGADRQSREVINREL